MYYNKITKSHVNSQAWYYALLRLSHGVVGKDTFVRIDDLKMAHGDSYFLVIMATDEVGECNTAQSFFTVDVTKPTEGVVGVGRNLTNKV